MDILYKNKELTELKILELQKIKNKWNLEKKKIYENIRKLMENNLNLETNNYFPEILYDELTKFKSEYDNILYKENQEIELLITKYQSDISNKNQIWSFFNNKFKSKL